MPYLDGKLVDADQINAADHKFIGMFRSPIPPSPGPYDLICPCGEILKVVGQEFSHWHLGHFDVPQYISIKNNNGKGR